MGTSMNTPPSEADSSDHDHVYTVGTVGQHLVNEAEVLAEALDGWDVVVSSGPYRGYDISYGVVETPEPYLYLDYYSVRPGTGRIEEIVGEVHDYFEAEGLDPEDPPEVEND